MLAFNFGRGPRSLLGLIAVSMVVACATVPGAGISLVQSPNDNYQYRFITLDNQLQVLLVSSPDSPKAAASLDVMVGSGDNPPGRGGLAHFLEHMLFLGTQKYPDAAEYERFVTEHGGNRNAYTSFEHTNYFFDIDARYLPEALDRFAQFFIAPQFDAQYVDREKNAVQAEYQMGLKSDARRGLDVLQEVMNPEHPFSQFSVGSLDSLADRPGSNIRDELLTFYDKHYSANAMRLVVMGSESLDKLQALVEPMFTPIPNKSFEHPPIEAPLFVPSDLPLLVEIEPQATLRQLQVSFPMADYRAAYLAKPLAYLGNLVGHEGEGSLLSQLKAEGLAEGLGAGSGLAWRGGSLFSVNITLTEKGAQHYEHVLQLLFAYTDMLRDTGPRSRLYDEQARLADLRFRFREKVEPMNYVSALSAGMHIYSPEDILRGPYIMAQYDEVQLADLLQTLKPENALVVLNDKQVETDLISVHYQVPYARQNIGPEQLARWQAQGVSDALKLPAANEFIPEDVSLVSLKKSQTAEPTVALDLGRQKLWFAQDDEYRVPKGATYINFRSPNVGQSPDQTAAAVLYTELLKDSVNEFAYPALLAGLSFDLYKHSQGISLRVTGYNDKQPVLLDRLLAVIKESTFDSLRFTNIQQDMIRSLQNSVAKRPSSQVIDDMREALLYQEWGEHELISALQNIDEQSLRAYINSFWQTATAETMVYGNYDLPTAAAIAEKVAAILSDGAAPALPDMKVLQLAAGESIQYKVNVPHDDSVVAWYLQGAGDSWEDRAATALTAQIMKSGFFQQLRTEQQLGYIVSSFAWPQMDVPGLVMLVQSPSNNASSVTAAMELFMQAVPGDLEESQFDRHKSALINEIMRPDKNLWERAEFYWQSIAKKQYDFSSRDNLVAAVRGLNRSSWEEYYQRVFLQQRHSLQVIAPGHWGDLPQHQGPVDTSATAIKQGHSAYLVNQ